VDGASFEVDDTESEVRELPLFAEAPAESSPVSKSTDMVDVEETDVAEVEEDVDVDGAIETEDGVRYESTLIFLMMQTVGSGFPSGSVQCFLLYIEMRSRMNLFANLTTQQKVSTLVGASSDP